MYTREQIQALADNIKAKMPECDVFLFGSYAYGNPRPTSDVDLAVIVPDDVQDEDMMALAVKARQSSGYLQMGIQIDIILRRKTTFANAAWGCISFDVREKGVRLA